MGRFTTNEVKEIALKLATVKYFTNSNSIHIVLHNGNHVFLNDKDAEEIYDSIFGWRNEEPIVNKLFLYWRNHKSESLLSILDSYSIKSKQIAVTPLTVCKFFWKSKPAKIEREEIGRCWVDYIEQIKNGNIISASENDSIWAAELEMFPAVINRPSSIENYGDHILILKTITNEPYISTPKKEIIGDRFQYIYHGSLENEQTWFELQEFIYADYLNMIDTNHREDDTFKHEAIINAFLNEKKNHVKITLRNKFKSFLRLRKP